MIRIKLIIKKGDVMKKYFIVSVFMLVGFIVLLNAKFDPKKAACEQACKKSYKECADDAKDDTVKLAACEVAQKKCLSECEK